MAGSRAPQPTSRRTQADRSDQAVKALRQAALELMIERGIAELSLKEVGNRAGYSRGIVHYHFGSKDDLLAHLLEESAGTTHALLTQSPSNGPEALDRMLATIVTMIQDPTSDAHAMMILLIEASGSRSKKLQALVARFNTTLRAEIEHTLAGCVFKSGIEPADAATLIVGTIRGLCHQWLVQLDSFDLVKAMNAFRRELAFRLEVETTTALPRRKSA